MTQQQMAPAPESKEGAPAVAPTTMQDAPPKVEQQATPASSQPDAKTGEAAQAPFELKAPEGKQFDAEVLGTYTEAAKALGLKVDAAQTLLDKVAPVLEARQAQQIAEVRTQWESATKADKEIGGDKLATSLATAKKALDAFGSPELRQLLESTGLGNHPEIVRAFAKAGSAISEDRFVSGQSANAAPKDIAKIMFPDMS